VPTDPVPTGRELRPGVADAFLRLSPDAAVVVDASGTMVAVNERTAQMFGYRVEELDGRPVDLLIPDRFRAGHQEHVRGYVAAPTPRPMGHPGLDLRGVRADGAEFPIDVSLAPLPSAGGVALVVAAIRDVTQQREREKLAARLAAIVQASDAAILSTGPDRAIDSWNPAAETMFGFRAAEVLGRALDELLPEAKRGELSDMYARLSAGERVLLTDTVRLRKDGTAVCVAVTASAIRDGAGRIIGFCEVLRDMTERRREQRELADARAERELFAERERIARQLHDSVMQKVFSAGIAVHSAESLITDDAARQRLRHAVDELDAAIKDIRTSIYRVQSSAEPDRAAPG
jgi:PAS domain S-box-containing protein